MMMMTQALRYRNGDNDASSPAGLRAGSDSHLVLQQAPSTQEHGAHDVQVRDPSTPRRRQPSDHLATNQHRCQPLSLGV